MDRDVWLLAAGPDGVRSAVHLGDVDPGDATLVGKVRAGLGVPDGDPLRTGWEVQITEGRPHDEWLTPGRVYEWKDAQ